MKNKNIAFVVAFSLSVLFSFFVTSETYADYVVETGGDTGSVVIDGPHHGGGGDGSTCPGPGGHIETSGGQADGHIDMSVSRDNGRTWSSGYGSTIYTKDEDRVEVDDIRIRFSGLYFTGSMHIQKYDWVNIWDDKIWGFRDKSYDISTDYSWTANNFCEKERWVDDDGERVRVVSETTCTGYRDDSELRSFLRSGNSSLNINGPTIVKNGNVIANSDGSYSLRSEHYLANGEDLMISAIATFSPFDVYSPKAYDSDGDVCNGGNTYTSGTKQVNSTFRIYREAEALFGSIASISVGNKTASIGVRPRMYGDDYYSNSVKENLSTVSSASGNNLIVNDVFMPSANNGSIDAVFSHKLYRGLNTRYDSYFGNGSFQADWTTKSVWDSSEKIASNYSSAPSVNFSSKPEFNQLTLAGNFSRTATIRNGNDVGLGEYAKSFCETETIPGSVLIKTSGRQTLEAMRINECVRVNRPWNFALNLSTSLPGDEGDNILIANGQSKSGTVNIGNNRYEGSPEGSYQTETPNFDFRIYTFALGEDAAVESIPGSLFTQGGVTATGDIEGYLTSAISDLSGDNITQPLALQNNGGINKLSYGGDSRNVGVSFGVSEDTDPGTKFCIVAAVNYVNSGYSTSNNGSLYGVGYGDLTGQSTWLISNISCRSTASKSSFQVLGGDIYSRGAIDVSATRVHGQSFGSWVDYGLTSAGEITFGPFLGLASGAFGTFGRSEGFIYDSCKISDMTISNSHCGPTDDKNTYIGRSGIYQDFITTNNAAQYFSTTNPPSASRIMLKYITKKPNDPDPVSGTYRKLSDYGWGESAVNGTQVIHVSDAGLVIDQNLYYDSETIYESPSQIPQRIIIVDNGNVVIPHSVTNIDAWIIVKNGNLITCIDDLDKVDVIDGAYQIPAKEIRDSDVCNNRLKINGYVSSSYLELTRTYYKKSSEVSDSLRELYDNYGERITLPYSALVWSYTNYIIESTTNLNTTGTTSNKNFIRDAFTQSLPPRY